MKVSSLTRELCAMTGISLAELARRTGQAPSNLSRKMSKETITFEDFQHYLDAVNAHMDVNIVTADGSRFSYAPKAESRALARIEVLESQLEAEKKKSEFVIQFNHDFRTAFEVVMSSTMMALKHSDDSDLVKKCLLNMKSAEQDIISMVNESMAVHGTKDTLQPIDDVLTEYSGDIKGLKVVLAEDNSLNREIIKELLEDNGAVVTEAEDGAIALGLLKEAKPGDFDVVVMDISMPNMDGYKATQEIRALKSAKVSKIPVIGLSANATEADSQKAKESGLTDYLTKPVNIRALVETIIKYAGK